MVVFLSGLGCNFKSSILQSIKLDESIKNVKVINESVRDVVNELESVDFYASMKLTGVNSIYVSQLMIMSDFINKLSLLDQHSTHTFFDRFIYDYFAFTNLLVDLDKMSVEESSSFNYAHILSSVLDKMNYTDKYLIIYLKPKGYLTDRFVNRVCLSDDVRRAFYKSNDEFRQSYELFEKYYKMFYVNMNNMVRRSMANDLLMEYLEYEISDDINEIIESSKSKVMNIVDERTKVWH